ncbi:hypothetical protein [Planctellipticum variicoloris]|uniref:hypothetical protein n=1 Tax=Planctellipticum variicoloris TaxID=3064265 RepID=UPI003013857A|nr:hypothetical protein SH412_004163 [Planctomycetaceae bacterium SH412]
MDQQIDGWWLSNFGSFEEQSGPFDYRSLDGRTVLEVKRVLDGSRGLHAAAMQLAMSLNETPFIKRACLVMGRTRMSRSRIEKEWNSVKSVLHPSIADRLAIILVEHDATWVEPNEPFLRRIADHFEYRWKSGQSALAEPMPQTPGQKHYEIAKVLLSRWLTRQGPIPVGELAGVVGCSYPTVRKSLDDSALGDNLTTTSSRSVELRMFPHVLWSELVALAPKMRRSLRYRDRSGDKPSPQSLLARLERNHPAKIAMGGVVSARDWDPDFDLHGTPRIDLVCHAPDGEFDLSFVKRLDPALERTDDANRSPVLVVHILQRASSLFVERPGTRIPLADPVETALDLYDLSLTVQANELLSRLRPEARLA